ncbi:MAG: TorF family putative porin [Rhodoferax sp.]
MRGTDVRVLAWLPRCHRRAAVAALLLACTTVAQAQLAGTVGVDSDYRFRGVSLSDSNPAVRLGASYDAANGWYGGVSGTGVALVQGQRYGQLSGYLGYVKRGARGLDWELGSTASHFVGSAHDDYAEAYAGLLGERWNLRLYYSPNYFASGVQTVYAELNADVKLNTRLRLFSHVGALAAVGGHAVGLTEAGNSLGSVRTDARAGIGIAIDPVDLQLAWAGASRGGPPVYGARRGAWVLSLSWSF